MSTPRERAESLERWALSSASYSTRAKDPIVVVARDLLAALDRVEELERALRFVDEYVQRNSPAARSEAFFVNSILSITGAALASAAASEGKTA